jgi:hypothetical protein
MGDVGTEDELVTAFYRDLAAEQAAHPDDALSPGLIERAKALGLIRDIASYGHTEPDGTDVEDWRADSGLPFPGFDSDGWVKVGEDAS